MATSIVNSAVVEKQAGSALRESMEELLINFYSVVGVAPRRTYPVDAAELLADDFEGQFFIQTSSELMVFSKAQMLAAKVGRGESQRPSCQMLSLSVVAGTNGVSTVVYAAAFRFGQTAQVRRGSFKASQGTGGWKLQSIEEDVRVVLLPERSRRQVAADRPRVWIL